MPKVKPRRLPVKPIDRDKFARILRSAARAKDTGLSMSDVAEYEGVSLSTVNAVRRTGTWAAYVAEKKARRASRKKLEQAVAKDAQAEDAPKTFTITQGDLDRLARIEHLVTTRLGLVPKLDERLAKLETRVETDSATLERLSSWVRSIDTRLSNLRSRAVKWPFGRR